MAKVFCSKCMFAKYAKHECRCKEPTVKSRQDTYWAAGGTYDTYEDIRMKNAFNDCSDYKEATCPPNQETSSE